jgi:hypothetical protein
MFLPLLQEELEQLIIAPDKASEKTATLRASFASNLRSVSMMCSIPLLLGQYVEHGLMFQRARLAEEVRRLAFDANPEMLPQILAESRTAAFEYVKSQPSVTVATMKRNAATFVGALGESFEDMFRQCLVLAWNAFEILATDGLRSVLNARPRLLSHLYEDSKTRELFQLRNITVERILQHDLDLRNSAGDFLLQQHQLDNLRSIKLAFGALPMDCRPLLLSMDDNKLYLLNQERNLIVHRRGIVDADYKTRMQSALELGERVSPQAEGVRTAVLAVRDVGIRLLECAEVLLDATGAAGELEAR